MSGFIRVFARERRIPLCETALTLTTQIAAQSFKKLEKDCGVIKRRSRVTGEPQNANRPAPPVRAPVAAVRTARFVSGCQPIAATKSKPEKLNAKCGRDGHY